MWEVKKNIFGAASCIVHERERERERERIISFSPTDQISFNCVYPSYFSSSYYQHWESLPLFALPHPFVSLAFGPHGQDGGQGSKPCGNFGKNQGKARVYLSHVTTLEKLVIRKKKNLEGKWET